MEELGIGRPSTYASTLAVLRDRDYVRLEKKRLIPEDKGRLVTAFLEVLLRQIRRLRLHRRARGEARQGLQQRDRLEGSAARLLDRFFRRARRHQGFAHQPGARQPQRAARAAYLPRPRRRRRSAPMPVVRQGAIVAEARQVRRLHRLLELSRMQVHPRAVAERSGRRRAARASGPACARSGIDPDKRRRDHAAQRPLRRLRAAGRGREAETLLAAQGPLAGRRHAGEGHRAAVAAARGRPGTRRAASRSWPASGATGPTCSTARPTPISAATTTCWTIGANRAIDLIVAKESGAGRALRRRRRGRALGDHPTLGGAVTRQGGPLRPLRQSRQDQRDAAEGKRPRVADAGRGRGDARGQGRGRRRRRARSAIIPTAARSRCAPDASAPTSIGARSTRRSRSRPRPRRSRSTKRSR